MRNWFRPFRPLGASTQAVRNISHSFALRSFRIPHDTLGFSLCHPPRPEWPFEWQFDPADVCVVKSACQAAVASSLDPLLSHGLISTSPPLAGLQKQTDLGIRKHASFAKTRL